MRVGDPVDMPAVMTLGEAVMDLFASPPGTPLRIARSLRVAPGGAPANVAVCLARLGVSVGFVGVLGNDPFGDALLELLSREGVDIRCSRQLSGIPTSIAIVDECQATEQSFVVYRTADTYLRSEDIVQALAPGVKMLVYGSVTLSDASRGAAQEAVSLARQRGICVVFDANYRGFLWQTPTAARDAILQGVKTATVCKVNEIELELLTSTKEPTSGSRRLLQQGPRLCLVTLGASGSYFNNGRAEGFVPAFDVDAVDTTGCGDAYLAGMVCGLMHRSLAPEALDRDGLYQIGRFANAAGALTATRLGAMAALPTKAEVDRFLLSDRSL